MYSSSPVSILIRNRNIGPNNTGSNAHGNHSLTSRVRAKIGPNTRLLATFCRRRERQKRHASKAVESIVVLIRSKTNTVKKVSEIFDGGAGLGRFPYQTRVRRAGTALEEVRLRGERGDSRPRSRTAGTELERSDGLLEVSSGATARRVAVAPGHRYSNPYQKGIPTVAATNNSPGIDAVASASRWGAGVSPTAVLAFATPAIVNSALATRNSAIDQKTLAS